MVPGESEERVKLTFCRPFRETDGDNPAAQLSHFYAATVDAIADVGSSSKAEAEDANAELGSCIA